MPLIKDYRGLIIKNFQKFSKKVLTLYEIKGIVLNNHKQGDVKWLNRRHHWQLI